MMQDLQAWNDDWQPIFEEVLEPFLPEPEEYVPDPNLANFWLSLIALFSANGTFNSLYGDNWAGQLAILASIIGTSDPTY